MRGVYMGNIDDQILRATKEIVVKFIEAGRISPSGFHETFKDVYHTIEKTTKRSTRHSGKEVGAESAVKDRSEKKKS